MAEEAVAADGAPASADDWFWLIDPLDGTRGFVEGREAFTVNIALIHKGSPVAGVVTRPATATTWRSGAPGAESLPSPVRRCPGRPSGVHAGLPRHWR